MSDVDMIEQDQRDERASALDQFARAGEGGRREVSIPQQVFGASGDRIVGAQEVAVYRDESKVLAKLKALAAAAGADWYYRYPVKNKKENRTDWIEGPSIKLANDLARLYGNCDVDIRVQDLGDSWVFYARFTDFETGFSLTRPFQQDKNASRLGGADDARRKDIAFQIGVSKAERNVVVNALQTFADFAFEEARGAIIDKIGKNLPGYRTRILQGFESQKIDPKRAEAVVGRAAGEWLAPDIARIIAMMKAVADGMATWDETFPPLVGGATAEAAAATEKADLDTFAQAKSDPPQSSSPEAGPARSAPADTPPSAASGAGQPDGPAATSPAALTEAEKKLLRRYAEGLAGAKMPNTLQKASSNFLTDNPLKEGSPAFLAAGAVFEAHRKRIAGESSPADADADVRKVLA